MSKRILFGGLLAVGLMAASAGTASAQFVTPFGQPVGSFGAVYPTPSGGIVQKQGYTNPFNGNTVINKQYSNPFTGVVANKQIFIPGGGGFYNPGFGGGFYNPGFGGGFGHPSFGGGFGNPGFGFGGANVNFGGPRFGVNIGFGRIFP